MSLFANCQIRLVSLTKSWVKILKTVKHPPCLNISWSNCALKELKKIFTICRQIRSKTMGKKLKSSHKSSCKRILLLI